MNVFTQYKKIKFSIKDFLSKRDQICSFLRIWSHLPKKSLIENLFVVQCWALREKRPYSFFSHFLQSLFSFILIRTEYGDMRSIPLYSVWMRENTDTFYAVGACFI